MEKKSRIYVAGHLGLAGSAIYRALKKAGYQNIITRSHSELELLESIFGVGWARPGSPSRAPTAAAAA